MKNPPRNLLGGFFMQGKRLPKQGAFAKLVEQQICFHDALLVREREDEDAVPALLGVELRQMSRVQQTARFLEVESEREGKRQNFCARGILVAGKDMVGVCGFESRGADDIAFRSILLREKLREIRLLFFVGKALLTTWRKRFTLNP